MVQIKQKRGTGVESLSPRSFSGGRCTFIGKAFFIQWFSFRLSQLSIETHGDPRFITLGTVCGEVPPRIWICSNLIWLFVFCLIPRLFVCLRTRMSTSKQYVNVYVKSIFICPGSIAGVPLRQATLAFLITAYHLCAFLTQCTWRASCVAIYKKKAPLQQPPMYIYILSTYKYIHFKTHSCVQGPLQECLWGRRLRPTLLLHTTCVRSWYTWRASCVAA